MLHHLALDVELEGVLPEVGVHDLARGLKKQDYMILGEM